MGKMKIRLKPGEIPSRVCDCVSCELEVTIGDNHTSIPYNDHSYCKPLGHRKQCYKLIPSIKSLSPLENRASEVLAENCLLQKELSDLSVQLKAKENQKNASLAACSLMKRAEKDAENKYYDIAQIKTGLQLKFACGTSGYNKCSQIVAKQPSPRVLQRRTRHIFNPGILEDIMTALGAKVKTMTDPRERDCALFFDAMATKPQFDLDIGTISFLGRVTLPGVEIDELASRGEVWMFGGIRQKWKQIACWHLVPKAEYPEVKSKVTLELLRRGNEIGLNIIAIVCDMGNRVELTSWGFSTKKRQNEVLYSQSRETIC